MMKQFERIFENPFSDKRITAPRLANFTTDCLTRLTIANTDGSYTSLISQLAPPLAALQTELGNVASSKGERQGKTLTVQQFLAEFKKMMSHKRGVIADAVGGFDSAAYLEFYPTGVTEYSKTRVADMPVLVKRLNTTAAKYADKLSSSLAARLQSFEAEWQLVSNQQQQVQASLSSDRTDRSTARRMLETALLHTVHHVADRFPGDVAQCSVLFNFSLLQTAKSHKEKALTPIANIPAM